MEKLNSNHKSIFFHMGPGFHAHIERHFFAAKYPEVLFVDQPLNLDFPELADWARSLVRTLANQHQTKLRLLGHSFGAQLAATVAAQDSEYVSEICLLNAAFDPFDCFANLEKKLTPSNPHGRIFWKSQSVEEKMKLIFYLSQQSEFNDAYWINSEAQRNYLAIALNHPQLNITTFIKCFSSFLLYQQGQSPQTWTGKSKILYSTQDLLIQSLETVREWETLFPQSQFIELPQSGHHGFFESSKVADLFFGGADRI